MNFLAFLKSLFSRWKKTPATDQQRTAPTLSADDLAACTGARIDRATNYLPYLVDAMREFGITSNLQKAAFLAQIGHESGGLKYTTELWGPTPAQRRYEGRMDLGNTQPGDGSRYRGRGFIQVTGRANYTSAHEALGIDCVEQPELLALPGPAARSAGWFWQSRGLNSLADSAHFKTLTMRINGGLNGYTERLALYDAALKVLA